MGLRGILTSLVLAASVTVITAPAAEAAGCASKAERARVAGKHYILPTVHSIFGTSGTPVYTSDPYEDNTKGTVQDHERAYRRCDSGRRHFVMYQRHLIYTYAEDGTLLDDDWSKWIRQYTVHEE